MNFFKKNSTLYIASLLCIVIAAVAVVACSTKQKAVANAKPATEGLAGKGHVSEEDADDHSPTTFIVMYDKAVGNKPLLRAIKDYGARVIYDYGSMAGMALGKPENKTLEETMQYFRSVKGVLSVSYDQRYKIDDPKPKYEEVKQ